MTCCAATFLAGHSPSGLLVAGSMGRSKDWGTLALVIAVNVVALSWLLQKLDFERVIDLKDFMFWYSNCGHYTHNDYLLYSQRTVLPQEIAAAAGAVQGSIAPPQGDLAAACLMHDSCLFTA